MSPKAKRCAVYTRKSSDDGLEQDFNSLHAQRQFCESYVASQAGEGWTVLPQFYDDGGFSGGNTDRPGLQALLADIRSGVIDIVVVYKIDRLTRSLNDFAKIVDVFDRHSVSIVSVTQPFNTTTSMGRLTLNVLLSFAQFEREVTSERIRDKIAASKKKGIWMGGVIPLGYDVVDRALKINEPEAELVRSIFARYLALGSVHVLADQLAKEGVRSKVRTQRNGKVVGGVLIARGALYIMLSNRLYLGEIVHKDQSHPGLHPAIIDVGTFDAVQARLKEQRRWDGKQSNTIMPYTFSGKLFEQDGRPITPMSTTNRHGKRYRYYVTGGGRWLGAYGGRVIQRLSASRLEEVLYGALERIVEVSRDKADALIRAELSNGQAELTVNLTAVLLDGESAYRRLADVRQRLEPNERAWIDGEALKVATHLNLRPRGGLATVEGGDVGMTRMANRKLIAALRRGHKIAQRVGMISTGSDQLMPAAIPDAYERRLAYLAFLAPPVQAAVLNGDHSHRLTLERLFDIAELPSWTAQRAALKA